MSQVNVRLTEIFTTPADVAVTVKSVLIGGKNVVTGFVGALPGKWTKRTDTTGDGGALFALTAGRYSVSAQSPTSTELYQVLIDVPDDNVRYEHVELIVPDAGNAGLVQDISATAYSQQVMELAGLRIANDSIQIFNEDQNKWFPIFVAGALGAEEITLGNADVTVVAASAALSWSRAELEAAGLRIRAGLLELWNETTQLWYPLVVSGLAGLETLTLGDGDDSP